MILKENKVGGLTPPKFMSYYKATVVNTLDVGVRIDKKKANETG